MNNSSYIAQVYTLLYEEGKDLSNRQYGRLLRYVHDYVHKGVVPNFNDPMLLRFSKIELKVLVKVMLTCRKPEEKPGPEDKKHLSRFIAQFYDTAYAIGRPLPDSQYGRLLRCTHEYLHTGMEPNLESLSKIERKVFIGIKAIADTGKEDL
jgi:hypothetical protein